MGLHTHMSFIPFIPENAPFSITQRQWLNGYLAGLFSGTEVAPSPMPAQTASTTPGQQVLILFGSQTGTAEALAAKVARSAKSRGLQPRTLCMDQFLQAPLAAEKYALLVTSTYGDGAPPDNALSFWSALRAPDAPTLAHLRYSVLALGDRNYPEFCRFGRDCDERLLALGAQRLMERIDCDVEYEESAKRWLDSVLDAISGSAPAQAPAQAPAPAQAAPTSTAYSRANPFAARRLRSRLLTAKGSEKEVWHHEISLEGSGLNYTVGDALGVLPTNCPDLVEAVLERLGCDGEESVTTPGGATAPIRVALQRDFDLGRPSRELVELVVSLNPGSRFVPLLTPERAAQLQEHLSHLHLLDLLSEVASQPPPSALAPLLRKLQPRLYSISSSPSVHPGEVHLTVASVRYESSGRIRKGVCSTFLSDRLPEHTPAPVFVQTSQGFRLPTNPDLPVIMIGPGTGVAPFRAFLEERQASAARGRNWLLFGAQRESSDYLYREELEAWRTSGHLSRLSLAFSRDQEAKIYVQHRMMEEGAELWAWLQEGAHFYVCGDASRMAKDVDASLRAIAQQHGGLSAEAAEAFLTELRAAKRYQRDVY